MKNKNKTTKTLLIALALTLGSFTTWGQLAERWRTDGSQPYDITMTSGMILQPVWLTATSTPTNIEVVRAITTAEQLMAGDALIQNNRMVGSRGIPNNRSNTHLVSLAPSLSVSGTDVYTGVAYADIDEDNTTWQSSAAFLDFGAGQGCDTIVKAFLYWTTGDGPAVSYTTPYPGIPTMMSYTGSGASLGAGSSGATDQVLFKGPGDENYTSVTGDRVPNVADNADANTFVSDVTALVRGKSGGLYWVANAKSGLGEGDDFNVATGWSLVVIFAPQDAPPRSIVLMDGSAGSGSINLNLPAQATANNISYLGYMTIDSENHAASLAGLTGNSIDCTKASAAAVKAGGNAIRVKANNGSEVNIAQFTEQPPLTFYNINGSKFCDDIYDASASSTMSTFNPTTGLNGSDFLRLPSVRYNPGYDAHHVRLPNTAVPGGATSVRYTVPDDGTGGHSVRMAYLAVETAQANLKLYMKTDPMPTTVPPGGQLTYELRVENIGTLPTTDGYVENTLPIMADLQNIGTIQYFDKNGVSITPPSPATVTGEDTDNEKIRFPLPAIAAGNGLVATDWVTIKYTVDIKDLGRTDIWSYGCNRFVLNVAEVFYSSYAGASFTSKTGSVPSGTPSQLGCDAEGIPVITNVSSPALDDAYAATRIIKINADDIDPNPNPDGTPSSSANPWKNLIERIQNSTVGGSPVNIVTELNTILVSQYSKLGLNTADLSYYAFYREGIQVNPGENFTVIAGEDQQEFAAIAILPPNDCEEQFTFRLELARIPIVSETPDGAGVNAFTSAPNSADATLNIAVSNGTPSYVLQVFNTTDLTNPLFIGYSGSDYTFSVSGLAAGNYVATVVDGLGQASSNQTTPFVVADPDPIAINLESTCNADNTVSIKAVGAAPSNPSATLDYVWKEWNGTDWATSTVVASADILSTAAATKKYQVTVCDGQNFSTKEFELPEAKVDPNVITAPASREVTFNGSVTPATGNYAYQWAYSAAGTGPWINVSGTTFPGSYSGFTSLNLNIRNIEESMDKNKYKFKVHEASGCVASADALLLTKAPSIYPLSAQTSCSYNTGDAVVNSQVTGGDTGEQYTILLFEGQYSEATPPAVGSEKGTESYTGGSPITLSFGGINLSSTQRDYTITVETTNNTNLPRVYLPFVVTAPDPIVVNIFPNKLAACAGDQSDLVITSSVTGGPAGGAKSYQWKSSIDDISFGNIAGKTSETLTGKLDDDTYFKLTANVGTCVESSNSVFIEALPTPKVDIKLPVDTGCFKFDLHNLQIAETSGEVFDYDYKLSLHTAEPVNATDMSRVINEGNYVIHKSQKIYVMMSVRDMCYNVKPATVYIKDMEECYPFTIPDFFSPDGNGANDLFQIDGLQEYNNPEIKVFDRYGVEVFKGKKEDVLPPNGWDGTYKGEDLPSGDYWYVMTFDEIKTKTGSFVLKRKKE